MQFHSVMSLNRKREHSKGVMQTHYAGTFPFHSVLNADSVGLYSLHRNLPLGILPPYEQTKQPNSLTQSSFFQPQNLNISPVSSDFISRNSHGPAAKSTMFYTDLHSSSLTTSETDRQLGISPFFRHSPTGDHVIPAIKSPDSSFLVEREVITESEKKNLENLRDILDVPVENSCRSFQGLHHDKESLTSTEKLILQYLSKELEIPVDDDTQSPALNVSSLCSLFLCAYFLKHTCSFMGVHHEDNEASQHSRLA